MKTKSIAFLFLAGSDIAGAKWDIAFKAGRII
jgi:hypothetical protein